MSTHKLTVNNLTKTPNPGPGLLVTGWRGSDLGNSVAVGTLIPPGTSNVVVATATSGAGDQWDWVFLLDLGTKTRYQIYWESNSGGKVYTSLGYYNPTSSESKSNPSPFPANFSKTVGSDDPTYTLLATPPPAPTTDIQALTDYLGYLLVGNNFVYSASVAYNTASHKELAPYISEQVTVKNGTLAFDDPSTAQYTVSGTYPASLCYDNPSPDEPLTESYSWSKQVQTTVTFTLTETLSISDSFSVKMGVPGFGESTDTFTMTFTVTTTQTQTSQQTHTWTFTPSISVPPGRSMNWEVVIQEISETIGFTAPVLMQGAVAIRSKQNLPSNVISQIGSSYPIQGSTDYLILAQFGSLWQYLQTQFKNTLTLSFTYQSPDTVAYNLTGLFEGGPGYRVLSTPTLLPQGTSCSSGG